MIIYFFPELVKHGKQVATIEIGILNCGSSAFKHELYGKSIVVERRISVSAGGGYKMKAWDGNYDFRIYCILYLVTL